jgi:quercetin dioxygenase-like cupin family protein
MDSRTPIAALDEAGGSRQERWAFHLTPEGPSRDVNTDAFWNHQPRDLDIGVVVCAGPQTVTWDRWERHPNDDEIAVLLAGAVEVDLEDGERSWRVTLTTHAPQVIPAGTWHRLEVMEPAQMLFVTPRPSRTEQRDARGAPVP